MGRIAKYLNVPLVGGDVEIHGLGLCNRPSEHAPVLSYATSAAYVRTASDNTQVGALLLTAECCDLLDGRMPCLVSRSPEEDFYKVHEWLRRHTDFYEIPDFAPRIGEGCDIHPTAVIENGVVIGDRVEIGAHSVVKRNTGVGNDVRIGCCSVVGSVGFQIVRDGDGVPFDVWHAGGVEIGDHVWIGNQVTVENALFEGSVTIGDHAKVDSMCIVGHNCRVGSRSVLARGVLMCGSSSVEQGCWLGAGAVVSNRVVVGGGAVVGANSFVNRDVAAGDTVVGSPARPIGDRR